MKIRLFFILFLFSFFDSVLGQDCGPAETTITDISALYQRKTERVYASYLCGVTWTSSANVIMTPKPESAVNWEYVDITQNSAYSQSTGWVRATLSNGEVIEDQFDVIPYQYITELPTMTVGKEEKVEVLYLNGLSVTWTSSESVVIVSSDDNFAIITPALNNRSGKGWIKATLGNGITIENQLDINLGATITDISTIYGGQEIRVEVSNLNNLTINWTSSELISIVSTDDNFAIISTTSNEGSSNGWIKATLSNGIVLQDEFDIKTRPTITDISTIYGGQEIRVEVSNLNNLTINWTSSELISIVSTDDNFAIISTTSNEGSSNGWIKATLSNGIVLQDEFDIKTRPTITDISTIYGGQEIRVEVSNLNNLTINWTSSELISIVSTDDNFAIISTTSDNGSSNGWIKATLSNGIVLQDEFNIKTRPTITDISTIYGGQEIRVEVSNLNNLTINWTSSELISIVSTDDNFAIISTTSNEGSSNGWIKATLSNGIVIQDEFDIKTRPTITDISTIYGGQEIRVEIFNLNNLTINWTSSELISIVSTDDNFAIISTTSNEGSSNGWIKATLSNGIVLQDEFDIKTRPTITDISTIYGGQEIRVEVSNLNNLTINWTSSELISIVSTDDNFAIISTTSNEGSSNGWIKATLSNGIVLQDEFDIKTRPTITDISTIYGGQEIRVEVSNLNNLTINWTSSELISIVSTDDNFAIISTTSNEGSSNGWIKATLSNGIVLQDEFDIKTRPTITDISTIYGGQEIRVEVSNLNNLTINWTSSELISIVSTDDNFAIISTTSNEGSSNGWIKATLSNGIVLQDEFDIKTRPTITDISTIYGGQEIRVEVSNLNNLTINWTSSELISIVSTDDNFAIISTTSNEGSSNGWIKATLSNGIVLQDEFDIKTRPTITDISTIYGGQEIRVEVSNLNNLTINWTSSELISIVSTDDNFAIISTTSNEGSSNGWIKATLSNGIVLQDEFDIKTRPTITDISTIYGGQEIRVEVSNLNNLTINWTSSELISIVSTDDNFAIISTTSNEGSSNGWIKATLSNGIVLQDEFDIKTRPTITDISTIYGGQEIRVEVSNLNNETATWTSSELISIVSTDDNFAIISTTSNEGSSNGWIKATLSNGIVLQDEFDIKTRPTITDISTIYGGQEIRVEVSNLNNLTINWTSSELISIVSTDDNFAIISTTSNEGSSNGWIKATLSNGIVLQDEFDIKTRPTITDISTIYGGQEIRVEVSNLNNLTINWTSSELISIVSTDDNFAIISTTSNEGSSNGWIKATLSNGIVLQDEFDIKTRPTITDISTIYGGQEIRVEVSNLNNLTINWTSSELISIVSTDDNFAIISTTSNEGSSNGWIKATLSNGIVLQDEFDIKTRPTITDISTIYGGQEIRVEVSNLNNLTINWTSSELISIVSTDDNFAIISTTSNEGSSNGWIKATLSNGIVIQDEFDIKTRPTITDISTIYGGQEIRVEIFNLNNLTINWTSSELISIVSTDDNFAIISTTSNEGSSNGWIKATLSNGIVLQDEFDIKTRPTITDISILYIGGRKTLSVSNIDDLSITWTYSDNVFVPSRGGIYDNSITIMPASDVISGTGWVKATLSNGIVLQDEFDIRPVPTITPITSLLSGQKKKIEISNLNGQKVAYWTSTKNIKLSYVTNQNSGGMGGGPSPTSPFNPYDNDVLSDDGSSSIYASWNTESDDSGDNDDTGSESAAQYSNDNITESNQNNSSCNIEHPNKNFYKLGIVTVVLQNGQQISQSMTLGSIEITKLGTLFFGKPENITVSNYLGDNFTLKWTSSENVKLFEKDDSNSGNTGSSSTSLIASETKSIEVKKTNENIDENGEDGWVQVGFTEKDNVNSSQRSVRLTFRISKKPYFYTNFTNHDEMELATLHGGEEKRVYISNLHGLGVNWEVSGVTIIETGDNSINITPLEGITTGKGSIKATLCNGIEVSHVFDIPKGPSITNLTEVVCAGTDRVVGVYNLGGLTVNSWELTPPNTQGLDLIDNGNNTATIKSEPEVSLESVTITATLSNNTSVEKEFSVYKRPKITDIVTLYEGQKVLVEVTDIDGGIARNNFFSENVGMDNEGLGHGSNKFYVKWDDFTEIGNGAVGVSLSNGCEIRDEFRVRPRPYFGETIKVLCGGSQDEFIIFNEDKDFLKIEWNISEGKELVEIIRTSANSATIRQKDDAKFGEATIQATLSDNENKVLFTLEHTFEFSNPKIEGPRTLYGDKEETVRLYNIKEGLDVTWKGNSNLILFESTNLSVKIKQELTDYSGSGWVKAELVTNDCSATHHFNIRPKPAFTDETNALDTICQGSEVRIGIKNMNGLTANFSYSNNLTILDGRSNYRKFKPKSGSVNTGNAKVEVTLSNGITLTKEFIIIPKPTIIQGIDALYVGEEPTIKIGNPYDVVPAWTGSNVVLSEITNTSVKVKTQTTTVRSGSVTATLINDANCKVTETFTVRPKPDFFNRITYLCQGLTKSLSVTNHGGLSVVEWSKSDNLIFVYGGSGFRVFKATEGSYGSAWVMATFNNGISITDWFTIVPKPIIIKGIDVLYVGEEQTIEIENPYDVVPAWTGSNVVLSEITNTSVKVKTQTTTVRSGSVTATLINDANCKVTETFTVRPKPDFFNRITYLCQGLTKSLSVTNHGGLSVVEWSKSDNLIFVYGGSGFRVFKATEGSYGSAWVMATFNNGISITDWFTIVPKPIIIKGIDVLYVGEEQTIEIENPYDIVTAWTGSSNVDLSDNTKTSVKVKTETTSEATGSVTATLNNDTNCKVTERFTVRPKPPTLSYSGSSQLCQGSTKRIYISNRGSHAVTWSTSSNLQIVSRSNDYVTVKPKSGYTSGVAWVRADFSLGGISTYVKKEFTLCPEPEPIHTLSAGNITISGLSYWFNGVWHAISFHYSGITDFSNYYWQWNITGRHSTRNSSKSSVHVRPDLPSNSRDWELIIKARICSSHRNYCSGWAQRVLRITPQDVGDEDDDDEGHIIY